MELKENKENFVIYQITERPTEFIVYGLTVIG